MGKFALPANARNGTFGSYQRKYSIDDIEPGCMVCERQCNYYLCQLLCLRFYKWQEPAIPDPSGFLRCEPKSEAAESGLLISIVNFFLIQAKPLSSSCSQEELTKGERMAYCPSHLLCVHLMYFFLQERLLCVPARHRIYNFHESNTFF